MTNMEEVTQLLEEQAIISAPELQFLRKVLSEQITKMERNISFIASVARSFKRDGKTNFANLHWKHHRLEKKKLKKLANIQKKLKSVTCLY